MQKVTLNISSIHYRRKMKFIDQIANLPFLESL